MEEAGKKSEEMYKKADSYWSNHGTSIKGLDNIVAEMNTRDIASKYYLEAATIENHYRTRTLKGLVQNVIDIGNDFLKGLGIKK